MVLVVAVAGENENTKFWEQVEEETQQWRHKAQPGKKKMSLILSPTPGDPILLLSIQVQ